MIARVQLGSERTASMNRLRNDGINRLLLWSFVLAVYGATFFVGSASAGNGTDVTPGRLRGSRTRTYSISGTISGDSGVTVNLSGAVNKSTTTSSSGTYSFSGLSSGDYIVTPSKAGDAWTPTSQAVTISGGNVSGVNFTVSNTTQSFSISGVVSGGSGAKVSLSGKASKTTTADTNGSYIFSGLLSGNYNVAPALSGLDFVPTSASVSVSSANVTGVNFNVAATYSISGNLSALDGGSGTVVTLSGSKSATTVSDASGNYTFSGLLDGGTYNIAPTAFGYIFTPSSLTVTIVGADVPSNDFTVNPAPNLVFADEFDGGSLAGSWTRLNRQGDYSNSELQCYDPSYTQVANGLMTITTSAHSEMCGDATHAPTTHSYTSDLVQWTNFNFLYGTIEYRAKMAGGQGPWPAIWLLGMNCQSGNILDAGGGSTCIWPQPGSDEIDITEILGSNHTTVGQYVHSGSFNSSCTPTTSDTSANFHVYQLVWTASSLVWKIDGKTTCTLTNNIPSHRMYLMINTAVGGAGGSVSPSTLPQTLEVDYVRVTQ